MQVMLLFLLSLGHLVTDLSGGTFPMLLPVLKSELHLSYTALGTLVLAGNLSSSVAQPLFGIWSDRVASRWLLPLGCSLSALGIVLAGLGSGYPLILFGVLLSGIGSAAYHPEGSKQSFLVAGSQKATALSIYSVGGNIGYGLGPAFASFLLTMAGRKGMIGLLLPALVTALLLYFFIPAMKRAETERFSRDTELATPHAVASGGKVMWSALVLITLIVTIRSWVHVGVTTFVPLYYVNVLGQSSRFTSNLLTIFLLAGAFGTVLGRPLADRVGTKKFLYISMISTIPALACLPYAGGFWSFLLSGWSCFALISSFSTTLVYAQELMPGRVGLASGIMLGFAFGLGGLGALLLGKAADIWSVSPVLKGVPFLLLPAILLTAFLPAVNRTVNREDKRCV